MKYHLVVTQKQLVIIKVALEEFFRLPLNQWWDLADRLCMKGKDFSMNNPNHKNIFDRYITTRDAVREIFAAAGRVMWPQGVPQKDEEQQIAEDLWAVIRHQFWLDNDKRMEHDVAGGPVFQWGPEPLARISKTDDPTAKRAKWISWEKAENIIPSPDRHECSACHDAAQVLVNGIELLSPYCPNCGAKMDMEVQDG